MNKSFFNEGKSAALILDAVCGWLKEHGEHSEEKAFWCTSNSFQMHDLSDFLHGYNAAIDNPSDGRLGRQFIWSYLTMLCSPRKHNPVPLVLNCWDKWVAVTLSIRSARLCSHSHQEGSVCLWKFTQVARQFEENVFRSIRGLIYKAHVWSDLTRSWRRQE